MSDSMIEKFLLLFTLAVAGWLLGTEGSETGGGVLAAYAGALLLYRGR